MISPPKRRLTLTITAHGDDWSQAVVRMIEYSATLGRDHMHDPLDEPIESSGARSRGCTHTVVVRPDALTGEAYNVALMEWAEGAREQDDRPTTAHLELTPSQMRELERAGWGDQNLGAWLVARAREASDLRRDLDEAGRAALLQACSNDDLKRAVPVDDVAHKPCAACGGNTGWRMSVPAGSVAGFRCERCSTIARWLVRGLNGEVLALPEGAVPTHVRQARAHREARVETDAEIERLTALLERQRGAVLLRAGGGYGCPVPGAEAEDLRREIEALAEQDTITGDDLQALLDRVDARDSLAYLEAHDAE